MKKSKRIEEAINQLELGLERLEKKVNQPPVMPVETVILIDSLRKAGYLLQATADQFAKANSAQLMFDIPAAPPTPPIIVPQQDKRLRRMIQQAIGNLVDQSGMTWHQAWDRAYWHLYDHYRFHVWSRFAAEGHVNKLDTCAHHNMLSALHHVVMRMLATKDYATTVALTAV